MPHALLSIIFAATYEGKHQIVFAYPAHPAALPRTSRPTYGKAFALAHRIPDDEDEVGPPSVAYGGGLPPVQQSDETPEGPSTPPTFGEGSWLIKAKQRDPHAEPQSMLLGLDADTLADALLPNHTRLYNEKLELVINHLAFVGHPVHLQATRSDPPAAAASSPRSQPITDQSTSSLGDGPSDQSSKAVEEATPAEHEAFGLDRFNLVLAIDTPPDKHLSRQLDIYYRDIVVKVTAAFKGEERRNGWLTSEIRKCRKARAEWRPDMVDAITNRLCTVSSLCSTIAEIYDAIVQDRVAQLQAINGNLDMSILLHDELLDDKPLAGYRDVGMVDPFDPSQPGVNGVPNLLNLPNDRLARWHALLPLEEPANMLEELETGLVSEFVSMLTPRLTLAEYETLLDVDIDTIYQIARHLIYWRKARVVNVVNLQNICVPRQDLDLHKLPHRSREFSALFPALGPLPSLLSTLSSPAPFRRALPAGIDRTLSFDALVWLLRNDLLVQLHVFVRVVATPSIRRAAQRMALTQLPLTPGIGGGLGTSDDYTGRTPESMRREEADDREDRASSVINEPSRPSPVERRWLEQIMLGKPPEATEHFQRMLPFLNGRNHLDAVMMHTSLARREIRAVLDAFSGELVTLTSP